MPAPLPSTIPPGGGLLLPIGTTTRGTASCAHDHPTSGLRCARARHADRRRALNIRAPGGFARTGKP